MQQNEQQFLAELEKDLWKSADTLRSNLDAAHYKHAVLGLIFLKYVSDSFEGRQEELKARFSDPEDDYFLGEVTDFDDQAAYDAFVHEELENRDYYTEENIFWVPPLARWNNLKNFAALAPGEEVEVRNGKSFIYKMKSVNRLVDDALEQVENENPKLKNVLNKTYVQSRLDPAKLMQLINLFSKTQFHNPEFKGQKLALKSKDILGHVYEYFLGEFALAEGKKGGQYYTPKSIVTLIVEMLQPYKGRVYDPAMGSGGFFVQSERFIEAYGGKLGNISVYGQESNPTTWQLAAMNMAIRGIDFNFGKHPADTFSQDQHQDLRADFVMANPPFNMKEWNTGVKGDDSRWAYGTPPANNANFAWLQHMLYHLSPNGTAGVVLANMSLASTDRQEDQIRRKLVDENLVACIVTLPDKLFTSTPIGACIWILIKNKNKNIRHRKDEILFIDASGLFETINRTLNSLPIKHINKIAETFLSWRQENGGYEDQPGFCKSVCTTDVSQRGYALFPATHIDIKRREDSYLPVAKLRNRAQELHTLHNKVNTLKKENDDAIRDLFDKMDKGSFTRKTYKIGDILTPSAERLGDKPEPEILTCTETAGLVLQKERFSKRVATEDTSKYKIVRKTDVVYNPYLLWANAIDQCWIVDVGITSPAYEVFNVKSDFDPFLVGVALKSSTMIRKYDGISIGTVKRRRRAPPDKFLELEIKLPDLEEQKTIKDTSLQLQELISLYSQLTRAYKAVSVDIYSSILGAE